MRELFQVWPSAISQEDIDRIVSAAHQKTVQPATVFSSSEALPDIRNCTVRWLQDDWIEQRLWSFIKEANRSHFHVAVEPKSEIQFTEYQAEQGAHYGWHHDVNWNGQTELDRKLSITIQLSDSDDYEGGDFEFDEVKTTADFRAKGTVLVFPSYLRHRIHPIISGRRIALVAWFFGPRWR
jgi:PKHD-type hydroxylase